MIKPFLILGATKQELEGVLTNIDSTEITGALIGVGKVQAALNSLAAIDACQPQHVVVVGWAGSLEPAFGIGEAVIVDKVLQYDLDLRLFGLQVGQTQGADGKIVPGALDLAAPDLQGFRHAVLGSADLFVTEEVRLESSFIERTACAQVVDMESFAIAQACRMRNVPCTVLKVVSDDVDGQRPRSFTYFVSKASEVLARGLSQLLALPREKSPISL